MGLRDFKRSDRVPKEIVVRPGTDREVNLVKDLDLKSYDYPWEREKWSEMVGENPGKWCLATIAGKAVGFAIWRMEPDEAVLLRLGVRPDNRKKGVGAALLERVVKYARSSGAKRVSLLVPEIHCFPGHPDDVSQWLLNRKFRSGGSIVREHAFMYGQWVDGFRFVLPVERGDNEPIT